MAARTVSTLKFVGSVSLGLLTGLSYTLSTLTVPTLLTLPSATSASRALTNLTNISLTHVHALVGLSSTSFLLAYIFSPRGARHPYLLWTTLFVVGSGLTDYMLPPPRTLSAPRTTTRKVKKERKTRQRQMDASYEVLGTSDRDSASEDTTSGEEMDEEVNGEEVRVQMEGYQKNQIIRTAIAGLGFMMSVIGIWGDGSAADVVIIGMSA